ncbi:MAG: hypothetical protein ACR2F8_05025 [Caulobacteraceae bacterium]
MSDPPPQQGLPPPQVGVFWRVPDGLHGQTLIVDTTQISEAEAYGDFLTHARGHYEIWEDWRGLGAEGLRQRGLPLAILSKEYEKHPRGRVVFSNPDHTFCIYADRRLHKPAIVSEIRQRFGLAAISCVLKSDAHYRS